MQRQVVPIVLGKIIALIATMLMPMVLTRYLTQEEYGLYAQFYTIGLFIVGIFSMGFHTSLYYFYYSLDIKRRKTLLMQTFFFLIGLAFISAAILQIPLIENYLLGKEGLGEYLLYISLFLLFSVPAVIIEPLYVLLKDNTTTLFFPPAFVVLKAILIVGCIYFWPGIDSVFQAILLSSFLVLVYIIFYLYRETNFDFNFDKSLIIDQIRYSIPFGLAVALRVFSTRIDKIICLTLISTADFAIYAVAFYGVPGIQQVYDSLVQVYVVKLTEEYQSGNYERVGKIYRELISKTFSYTLPLVLIITLYADVIIKFLFTEKYLAATPLFRIYLISILFMALGGGLILRASGNTKKTLKAYFISSLITIPLAFILIKEFYLWGAITSSVIGGLLPIIFSVRLDIKELKGSFFNHFPWMNFLKIALISVISIIPLAIIKYYFEHNIITFLFFSAFYLTIVSFFEIRFEVFCINSAETNKKLKNVFYAMMKLVNKKQM
jgi:O-antigen/teichoic acid export membrane protein